MAVFLIRRRFSLNAKREEGRGPRGQDREQRGLHEDRDRHPHQGERRLPGGEGLHGDHARLAPHGGRGRAEDLGEN